MGSDGSIIVCTESGHVFVRSRNMKTGQGTSSKTFKFQRIPHLQRVTQVCANSTGAFGALRMEHKPRPIEIRGNDIAQDMATVRPYLLPVKPPAHHPVSVARNPAPSDELLDDEAEDLGVLNDVQKLKQLIDTLDIQKKERRHDAFTPSQSSLHGADLVIHGASGALFPAHRSILGIRSPVLNDILNASRVVKDTVSGISLRILDSKAKAVNKAHLKLSIVGCHPISILILLDYIYSDDVLAIWDGRTSAALSGELQDLKIRPSQIKHELVSFATLLELPSLLQALESPVKRAPPPSMASAMERLYDAAQVLDHREKALLSPDVILQFADKEIRCHSVVLRARSVFFADFLGEDVWTINRWDANGIIAVDMKHLTWRVMEYVLRFICCGADVEMFDTLGTLLVLMPTPSGY